MEKHQVLNSIINHGIVAVIRAENSVQAERIVEACISGGIRNIEITYTVPGASDIIASLTGKYAGTNVVIGAGTVLDAPTARNAITAGASFIVSPALNLEVVKMCHRYHIPVMPGALTPREVIEAMEAGADIVKIFPANLYGPQVIRALKGPLPQSVLMPTGGVNAENIAEWFAAGATAVGVGSELTASAKDGDYETITNLAKQMVAQVARTRR